MKQIILAVILVMMLTACGTDGDTANDSADNNSENTVIENLLIPNDVAIPTDTGLDATLTGELTGDISAFTGVNDCDGGTSIYNTAINVLAQEGIEGTWRFYMPQNLNADVYELGTFSERGNDNVVVISANIADKTNEDESYNRVRGGTIEIIEAGTSEDLTYSGRFIVVIGSDDLDGTTTATGNFMFNADDCSVEE